MNITHQKTCYAPVGSDAEVKAFMQLLTLDAARHLNYNREIDTSSNK